MTILVAHNRYRVRGGEDSVFESECRMLEEAGHRVVRYEKTNCDIPDRGGRLGLVCRTIWNPRTVREVRALIRTERPDMVHCHNTFPQISPSVYYAAAREGVPVVQTLHNYRLACLNGYLFRNGRVCEACLGRTPWCGLRHRCYRGSLGGSLTLFAMLVVHRLLGTWRRKVTRYVALTDFARDKFVAAGLPAEKIAVKPNAFLPGRPSEKRSVPESRNPGNPESRNENPRAREAENPSLRIAHSALRIVYLGRLSPEKGVDVLLRAWALLQEKDAPTARPHCSLTIIGDGPERVALESLASDLGIANRVRFAGALSRDEALMALSSASLLVFPSLWYEQFAITPLEAMALGVPVLASDVARGGTILKDGISGRFFRAGDPTAFAATLRDLLADPAALRRMGAAARAAFELSDCLPNHNLARLLQLYASCGTQHDA